MVEPIVASKSGGASLKGVDQDLSAPWPTTPPRRNHHVLYIIAGLALLLVIIAVAALLLHPTHPIVQRAPTSAATPSGTPTGAAPPSTAPPHSGCAADADCAGHACPNITGKEYPACQQGACVCSQPPNISVAPGIGHGAPTAP